jgi:mannitol-1-phosphate 5-dehydrogenase
MAVHFGAGNIGRGFLGQLYWESGYATTFVDVAEPVVAGLRERHGYPLHIVSAEGVRELSVDQVDAIPAGDTAAVAEALARADIASTAVGVNVLPRIAPALARGVVRRFSQPGAAPLDIIVCENLIGAGPFLRETVRKHLEPGWRTALETRVGFVEASIGRMVPVMTEEQRARDPLLVCVEPYCELPVDANGFKGEIPAIAHMKPMRNFAAYVERKLFVHNLSHAATAYLGHLRGHEYIWQAVEDPAVREKVRGALGESCEALHRRHGLALDSLIEHGEDLLRRYANKALGDQVSRVARDPMRKLGPNDRIAGAARACLEQGVHPRHIAFAAAAAMRYDDPSDPAAAELQRVRRERGIGGVLETVCQAPQDDPLATCIREADALLINEGWTNQR